MNEPADRPPPPRVDDLTWSEVADAVWLAAVLRASGTRAAAHQQAPEQAGAADPVPPPRPSREPEPSSPVTDPVPPPSVADRLPPAALLGMNGVGNSDLPNSALARALRPLGRRVASATEVVLDEEGMAVHAAETGLWLPVQRPAPVHRLDVVLVVDTSPSMRLWRSTAAELQRLLERQGAFRDVRRVDVDTDQEWVRSYTTPGPGAERALEQLVDPTGRRVIMVLTDGVGAAWRPAAVGRWLSKLGTSGPLVVLNVLEHRSWGLGRLVTEQVRLGAATPAVANRWLSWNPARQAGKPDRNALPVPVLELDGRWLSRWASLVTATGPVVVELPALLVGAPADAAEPPSPEPVSSTELVRRFHLSASEPAFRLAALLAAVPVTRSVLRAVQLELVPGSTLGHVAEMLLGGLIEPSTWAADEYRFRPGVRGELLSALRRDDVVRVVRTAAERVVGELPALTGLRDAIADPESAELPAEGPAAALQDAVLRALSGPAYVSRADRLGRVTSAAPETEAPPVWGGVPSRDRDFVDRDELAAVGAALSGDAPVVLRGEAGAGKTALVAEHVYRTVSDHRVVWWFAAHEPASVVAGYRRLALRLGLTGVGAGGQASVAAVHADLATRSDWLLVFDGAADPATLEPYLPADGGVVVTTRDPAWREHGTVVEVGRFTRAQSMESLRHAVSEVPADLADALGNLPSAVRHAGVWLRGGRSAGAYREALREGGPCAPAVDAVSPAGRVLLELCSAFGPWPVPRALLHAPVDLPPEAAEVLEDPLRAAAVLRELAGAGLVVVDHRSNTVAVPELVRAEVLAREELSTQASWRHMAHLLLASAPVSVDLVEPMRGAVECEDQRVRNGLLALVAHLVEQGDPHNASALADEVGGAWVAAFGTGHPDTVAMAIRWGVARRLLGDRRDALRVHRAHAAAAPELVRSLMAGGDVPAAVELARTLTDDGLLAGALRLAAVLAHTEVPVEARTLHAASLTRLAATRGDRDPATLSAMIDVSVTAQLRGEQTSHARKALPLLRVAVGTSHQLTLACATAVAGELTSDGDHEQAVAVGEATTRMAASAWGEEHPLTLAARLNLAVDLNSSGHPAAAKESREAAEASCLRALGMRHPLSLLAETNSRAWYDPDPAPGWTIREQ